MERYPNLKEDDGVSIPDYEISSLLDIRLARWLIASCTLTLAYRSFLFVVFFLKKKRKRKVPHRPYPGLSYPLRKSLAGWWPRWTSFEYDC